LLATPRVDTPESLRFALAAAAGYGMREALTAGDALHHTGFGSLAAALEAPFGLAAELRLDGRLEKHTAQGDKGTGQVGELRGYLRYARMLGSRVGLGGELGVWVPGAHAPSLRFDSTTLDALVFLDARVAKAWSLQLAPGFRYDRSGQAMAHPERLSTGDFVTLGLSDAHEVLVRAGVQRAFARGQLFLEWSWDARVGKHAGALAESPMQVALGGRAALTQDARLALTLSARALVSSRPEVQPDEPLIPFPPRVELWCGLHYQLTRRSVAPAPAQGVAPVQDAPPVAVAVLPVLPALASPAPLTLRVFDASHAPVSDASVYLDQAESSQHLSDAQGQVVFADVAVGAHVLQISADGFQPQQLSLQHERGAAARELTLQALPENGQLRLLVRDHRSGEPLRAEVLARPEALAAAAPAAQQVSAEGRLLLDLAPGRYVVTIKLKGYRKQIKKLEIEDKSVTILDVALHARSRR
jgi:hypothetical protein